MPFWPFTQWARASLYVNLSPMHELESRASSAFFARRWTEAEWLFRQVLVQGDPGGRLVARNMLGQICERQKRVDEAIALYEANIREPRPTSWPFERLALIYRSQQRPTEERRVLVLGVRILNARWGQWCSDRLKKMN
jgi:hypothetical protein